MGNENYYIGTQTTIAWPPLVTDPPDCDRSITYSFDGGDANVVILEQADPSIPEINLFYDSSLDPSDPNGLGRTVTAYAIMVKWQDALSGDASSFFFGLMIRNPCVNNELFTMNDEAV